MLGAYTLAAATTLLVIMIMAVWKVHLPNGFFLNWTGAPGASAGRHWGESSNLRVSSGITNHRRERERARAGIGGEWSNLRVSSV
jgi:hypothetical protein